MQILLGTVSIFKLCFVLQAKLVYDCTCVSYVSFVSNESVVSSLGCR